MCSIFISKGDIIDRLSSAAKDFFGQNFSFGGGGSFFVDVEVVEGLDRGAIFVGPGEIIEKIPQGADAVLGEEIEVSGGGFEEGFEIGHSFF